MPPAVARNRIIASVTSPSTHDSRRDILNDESEANR